MDLMTNNQTMLTLKFSLQFSLHAAVHRPDMHVDMLHWYCGQIPNFDLPGAASMISTLNSPSFVFFWRTVLQSTLKHNTDTVVSQPLLVTQVWN